jgi:protein phosphatase
MLGPDLAENHWKRREMSDHDPGETADFVPADEFVARFLGPPSVPMSVRVGAVSDRGLVRDNNEDHYAVIRRQRSRSVLMTNLPVEHLPQTDDYAYVLVVADGIGGSAFGELASWTALRTAWELGGQEAKWPMRIDEDEAEELVEKLEAYTQYIHRTILQRAASNPDLAGMGTTLTAAYTAGPDAFISHVGDSRAYLFRNGTIKQVTRDHTLAQALIDAGAPESDTKGFQNVLTNCLGGDEGHVLTDVQHFPLHDGDGLLLCTDGLSDLVDDDEMCEKLAAIDDPQQACQALVDLALERGGKDNITVVLARYEIMELPED